MYFSIVRNTARGIRRCQRADTSDADVHTAQKWILDAIATENPSPFPWTVQLYGTAHTEYGGLVVSVYGGTQQAFALRIAMRVRNGRMWPYPAASEPAHTPDMPPRPSEPWCCTTVLLPALTPIPGELTRIENAFSWAWAERSAKPA